MPQNLEVALPSTDDSADPAGGTGLPDPPDVFGINPAVLAVGSAATVVTVTGNGFWDGISQGLVNGQARKTQITNLNTLSITVTAADLASAGQLQIAVRNTQTSVPVTLTVQ